MELFLGTKRCVRGVSISFEFVDVTYGFPMSSGEVVVLSDGRFADIEGRFRVIIRWSR